jgi:hypothetical protein
MKKFKLLFFLILLISGTIFLGILKGKQIKIPLYNKAYNIEMLKKGKHLGINYTVKLKYPEEINKVFQFYDYYLLKNGWERASQKNVSWDSFIDINKIKVNYLTYRWINLRKRKEFILIIRYVLDSQKEAELEEIEEEIAITISSY